MDGKGASLPSIPEPANPISMKQLPEVLGVRKGRGDMNGDPAALLMDKAAAQLAATLHDSVLQKMAGHGHNNHNHERLKDLTARVLNGDQDKLPKLCAPEPPILKGSEAPATTGNHQRKCPPHSDPEFNVKITQVVQQPQFEPCCADGTALAATAKESVMNGTEKRQEVNKRKRRPPKPKPQPNFCSPAVTNTIPAVPVSVPVRSEEDAGIADKVAPVPEVKEECSVPVRFCVGDVVWTKVSGYPWWPCMVATDPELNQHIKPKPKGNNRSGLQYHVQYFGDAPERGYIFEKSMVTFSREEQYQELCFQGTKQSASRVLHKKTVASVPRKLRAQWNMGIVQAKEAMSMSLDDRMAKFAFVYDDDGPHLNPRVLETLRPEPSKDKDPGDETDLRLSPTLPALTSTSPAAEPAPVFPQLNDSSTSAGKKTRAPRGKNEKRERQKQSKGAKILKLSKAKAKACSSSKDTPQPQDASQDATTPPTDIQAVPPKQQNKSRKPKQQPLAPSKTVGKKNKSKSVSSTDSLAPMLPAVSVDKVKKVRIRKKTTPSNKELKTASNKELKTDSTAKKVPKKSPKRPLTESMAEKDQQPKNTTAKKVPKKSPKRPLTETMAEKDQQPKNISAKVPKKSSKRPLTETMTEKDQQPKKKRKIDKDAQKVLSTEGTTEKKQNNIKKADKVEKVKKLTKKSKAAHPGAEDQAPEKPKRKRKKAIDGQTTPTQNKKRRVSPCPEPEVSGSEGCPESPSDSLDGIKKGERNIVAKNVFYCQLCEQVGEDLVPCEGQCYGKFHLQCLGLDMTTKPQDKILCKDCSSGVHSCFSCKKSEGEVRRCHVQHCGKFYHEACVRLSPLTVFDKQGFRCPLHTCLSCHYSCRSKVQSSKGKMMRCMRCPVAYHMGDLCMAAGSEMITNNAIICTNHFNAKKGYSHHSHVNVSWCFVCSKGGQLLCCESCPAAFHPDCLNITNMPDGSWFCNDCRAGKKPKYKDIIWVKLGTYRWWPAEIQHPRNIPTNIQHLRHEIGEFPVKFFGSNDYFWTHQGRVFPYMEGDRGSKYQRTGIGKVFKNALLEAESRFKEIKIKQEAKAAQENNKKPPPYKFIKVNKPYGKVQVCTADISEIPKCNCKSSDERPCGFESDCLNRMLLYECHPEVCPNGERCCNQDFTKRLYPETKIIKAAGKGWGLVSLRDIKKGEFVNEYIGELIDEEECHARIKYAQENNITHFYMLTMAKDRIIDAGPKGNYSRFMNHSCQPNCETQKWTVNGDTRVGLFAVCDIDAGTELTFNYNLDCLGNEKTICRCGAPNCSGFLGDRPKNSSSQTAEPKGKKVKKKLKKKKSEGKKSEDECFRCGDGGQLVLCGKKTCAKAFHVSCLGLTKRPFGRWDCPWHHCDVCGKNSEAFCQLCPNSFCKAHQEGVLRPWPLTGQLCCLEHEEPTGTEISAGLLQTQAAAPEAAAVSAATSRPPKGKKNSRATEAKAAASSEPAKRLAKGSSRKKQGKIKAQTAL